MSDATMEPSRVSDLFIGRSEPLNRLRQAIEQAQAGRGTAVLLAGEAGIGKSRLVAEARRLAVEGGAQVLEGRCFEQDQALPYAPLLDLLRGWLEIRARGLPAGAVPPAMKQAGPILARLMPELAAQMPDLTPAAALPPEEERSRLYFSLTQFFAQLAGSQPIILVIEDLHWSDQASLDFVLHFARRLAPYAVLLLLTYRNEEVPPNLLSCLSSLERERLASEIVLERLGPAHTAELLRALLGPRQALSPDWLEHLCNLTEGNPFFVEEVVKSIRAASTDATWPASPPNRINVPRTVRAAVQQRTLPLSAAAQHLLTVAAVAGLRFDFGLLQALTGMDDLTTLTHLKSLLAAQLIVEESADRYAFRHALSREAVYAQLLQRERQALHQRVAETLEQRSAGQVEPLLSDLAYHYYQGTVWDKALDYATRAGQRAQAVYAPYEAIEHFSRALQANEQLARPASFELLRRRAQAHETAGHFDLARDDFERALSAARRAGNPAAEWQALIGLGFLWASRDYAQTGVFFGQALELARAGSDRATVAHSLNRLGNWCANVNQPDEALRHHQEALRLFQNLNDRHGLAETLDLLGMACQLNSDLLQAYQSFQGAIALWRELSDAMGLCSSLASVPLCAVSYLHDLGVPAIRLPEAARAAEEALQRAGDMGWRAGEAYASLNLAMCLGAMGEYARGLETARTTLLRADEIEHRQWAAAGHSVLGMLYLGLLAFDAARAHLEHALALATTIGSRVWLESSTGFLALTCIAQGELGRAEAILNEVLAGEMPMKTQGQRLCWYARVDLALARRQPAIALDIVERLAGTAPNASAETIIPSLWLARGRALAAGGQSRAAIAALQATVAAAAEQGQRPLEWRAQAALSVLYLSQVRRAEAVAQAMAARAGVLVLAAGLPDEELRRNFIQRAAALLPRPPAPSPARVEKSRFGGLTTREREVARLIARGKSNREIAAELVVGVRTVEAHVTRALNKLGFSSRAQIAAWAVENGLAGPPPGSSA